ncbi:uncharacterized protein LOC103850942 isoform X1 [Brassica rapa]|nr:uncharacterized protein LOC103850942 isoform X1 [Brassica rapa]XP_022563363.1 uncharacterized protein LOC106364620 isoform X1 [Brassica napus]
MRKESELRNTPSRQGLVLMEENLHRVSRSPDVGTHNQNDSVAEDNRRRRHYNHHTHGVQVKCSGRSWAAAAIADCVALCCCPCAIINFLTLTFVKVPWMIGRRCLGGRRKKQNKRRLHKRQRRGKINSEDGFHHYNNRKFETAVEDEKCGGGSGGDDDDDHRFVVERDGSLTKDEEEKTASVSGSEESRTSARVEAERVWLELYQIGHLGFGRVSFTGIQ